MFKQNKNKTNTDKKGSKLAKSNLKLIKASKVISDTAHKNKQQAWQKKKNNEKKQNKQTNKKKTKKTNKHKNNKNKTTKIK